MLKRFLRGLALLPLSGLLAGCNVVLLQPSGDVAAQQRDLIIASTGLMLLIIIPVIILTLLFAWRYRASNTDAVYDPDWHHSTRLEVVIWSAPLTIIIALGALTWISTHTLDPFRPLTRLDESRPVPEGTKPLDVEVVSLDWKWLFFYPAQGIASVNELVAPVDTPIRFHITSATVMNSFFIPALAGQVYAMAGMETQLHAVINKPGDYNGFSANYSGAGFSRMNFKFIGTSQGDFDAWVAKAKSQGQRLDSNGYLELEKPSEAEPVHHYASVEDGLFKRILNMCAVPGSMCADEMMHIDAMGGGGKESEANRDRLQYDGHRMRSGNEQPGATFPASGRPPHQIQPQGMKPDALTPEVNHERTHPDPGQGHNMPGMKNEAPAPAQLNDK
jgi:cytochrome o ubiquinol oxidase subunit 2